MRRFFICALLYSVFIPGISLSTVTARAAGGGVGPGEYLREYGMGTLKVDRADEETLEFHIDALGVNGHSCTVNGLIRNFRAEVSLPKAEPGMDKCLITFKPSGSGVAIASDKTTGEQCRNFCGARAAFEGNYLIPASGCNNTAREAARKRFARLYLEKDYAQARRQIEPLVEKCGKTLHVFENGRLRNDLAITQYHLQDFAGCLKTLAPMKRYAGLTRSQLKSEFAPIDAETMGPILAATATNLDLCMARTVK